MKKIIYLIGIISLIFAVNSCSEDLDYSQTVTILDEQDPNTGGGGTGEGGTGGGGTGGGGTPIEYPLICDSGFAGAYPCENYDLISWMSTSSFGATSVANDCWGWTDPDNGKEYAIYGLDNGTAFIDISDPENPIYTGKLVSNGSSIWRDIKVYNNYAYVVSEASGHGMQVFDLTELRGINIADTPQDFIPTTTYTGFGSAHNLVINEDTGFAYGVGTDTYGGGPHFVDLSNPANPVEAGGISSGYSHDGQAVIYNGPDSDYTGKEIFIGANENQVVLIDVTDKQNPEVISSTSYSNVEYTHQGWITENHQYFIVGDELDELNNGTTTRTIILDFTDLDNPQYYFDYIASNPSIDHNGYVKGNDFYLASYTAGLRVFDISNIENQEMTETGYFDVHPGSNDADFDGAWSVYPYFESGNIVISDIVSGLFIVKKQ